MIDEGFKCIICNQKVKPLKYSARNHCPFCLYSIHIDINPGDRENKCKGLLKPIGIIKFKHSYKIIHKCDRCKLLVKNIIADDDDINIIIELSKNPNIY